MAKKNPRVKEEVIKKSGFQLNDSTIAWGLAAFAFLLYAQTCSYDFALDDVAVITKNDYVKSGVSGMGKILHTFYWNGCADFAHSNSGIFRPVSLLMFDIEWMFAPKSPHFFHFLNVLLYAISVFVLYKVLRLLFRDFSPALALGSTLLWVVMPAHTEVVANVKSGDELISIIFFLMALKRVLIWSDDRKNSSIILATVYFFISLLSKEGAVLFLPVIFLALWMFRNTRGWKNYLKPGILLSITTTVWLYWHTWVITHADTPAKVYDRGDNCLTVAPDLISRFATAMNMQAKYFQKLFLGYPLSWDYSYNANPIVGIGDVLALLAIAICLGLLFIAIRKFKTQPVLSFGILFYFITFALTSNVIILVGATMADRFLFVPSVGAAIAITYLVLHLTKEISGKKLFARAVFILLPVVLLYSISTYSRSRDWTDQNTLFLADAQTTGGSGRVMENAGIIYMNKAFGMDKSVPARKLILDSAYNAFLIPAQLDSSDFKAIICLGEIEFNRGNFVQSAAWSKKYIDYCHALGIPTQDKTVYRNIADAFIQYNRFDSAMIYLDRAMEEDTNNDYVAKRAGECYLLSHDTVNAIRLFEKTVKRNPNNIEAWRYLANLWGATGDYDRSIAAFKEIIKIDPAELASYKGLILDYRNKHTKSDDAIALQYQAEYVNRGGQ